MSGITMDECVIQADPCDVEADYGQQSQPDAA
jgi:hypothetical protein